MKLAPRDRLRFAWELTWPMALIDLAVVFTLHGIVNVSGESADSIWAVVAFFGVSPWIVRRALNLRYGMLRIHPPLTYQQSLKVMWLLAWRTLALSLIALVPISLAFRALHVNTSFGDQSPLVNNVGLSTMDTISSLVFTPLLVGSMLRKRYRGFRLEVVEEKPATLKTAALKRGRK
ncbi:MAG TPA: hypothetical protein VMG40_00735 [Bryobacteraceae bacterium]|nr:hypothetical protein [Bryobacteraceae bacterium]